jgi:hypothetical protein
VVEKYVCGCWFNKAANLERGYEEKIQVRRNHNAYVFLIGKSLLLSSPPSVDDLK